MDSIGERLVLLVLLQASGGMISCLGMCGGAAGLEGLQSLLQTVCLNSACRAEVQWE